MSEGRALSFGGAALEQRRELGASRARAVLEYSGTFGNIGEERLRHPNIQNIPEERKALPRHSGAAQRRGRLLEDGKCV